MRQLVGLFWSVLDLIQRHPRITALLIITIGIFLTVVVRIVKKKKRQSKPYDSPDPMPYRPKPSKPKKSYKDAIGFISVGVIITGAMILLGISNGGGKKEHVLRRESQYVFGIDISHYQGNINWAKVKTTKHPIKYIIIRASMGTNAIDTKYERNIKNARKAGYIIGAYHYFRPNEDAALQFENFKKTVELCDGDLPPVLDIEVQSGNGNAHLVKEVQKWLSLAEAYYGVKPILYTGKTFYLNNLKDHIEGYPLWIAAYSGKNRVTGIDWKFHQFSEEVRVVGIPHRVDGNDFNGKLEDLKRMCIGYVEIETPTL